MNGDKTYNFLDKSAISAIIGGFVVISLLIASVFVYSIENPSIEQRRVSQILEKPVTFYGNTVSVEGEVENTIGTQALTVDGPGAIGDQLLVVSRDSLEPIGGSGIPQSIFTPTDAVIVEGQVREFHLKEVEEELGVDLDDELYAPWEGRPFVFASRIDTTDE